MKGTLVFEIFYAAMYCGGPFDGFKETLRAVNGVMLDCVSKEHPGPDGWMCSMYRREGYPNSDGIVRYVYQRESGA